jgi:hypothetical protein
MKEKKRPQETRAVFFRRNNRPRESKNARNKTMDCGILSERLLHKKEVRAKNETL